MKRLTPKQQEIYKCISTYQTEHGYPPSVREIGALVGLKSPSTVHFHLKGLVAAGAIVRTKGKTRAITLAPSADTPAAPAAPVPEERQIDPIPILGNVAAGTPILAQECIEDYLTFDTGRRNEEHFALRVRGESMLGAGILPGDLVVIHPQQDFHNGDIVVALFEDEATVKTLQWRDGVPWLMPANPDYQPIDGTGAQLLGRVVAVIRQY